jgi:hypothetical protein
LAPQRAVNAAVILPEVNEFDAAFDLHARRGEVFVKDGFGLGLRDEKDEREARVHRADIAQSDYDRSAATEMDHEPRARTPPRDERFAQAEALQHLQAARLDRQRARFVCAIQ